jgi:hypothetical protein
MLCQPQMARVPRGEVLAACVSGSNVALEILAGRERADLAHYASPSSHHGTRVIPTPVDICLYVHQLYLIDVDGRERGTLPSQQPCSPLVGHVERSRGPYARASGCIVTTHEAATKLGSIGQVDW